MITQRVQKLREESVNAQPSISIERALIETEFYKANFGKYPVPILRALNFFEICTKKSIYIGDYELIVGERGPSPKAVPTFPELNCHSAEDLRVLNTRELQRYTISENDIELYEREVIPYWRGKSLRDIIFERVPADWKRAYECGLFTEFMEQRAPGHTALDGKIYKTGLIGFKERIAQQIAKLDFINDPEATDKRDQLEAMSISCDAMIEFARRHSLLAAERAESRQVSEQQRDDLKEIARVCSRVPEYAPQTFHEALQMYWFIHLGTITELNGWDAMNPGHLDIHLWPFYKKEIEEGTLTRERAKELLSCFWIKFNNHPAPPKVGITAKESGTYNDFTNINIGGINSDGSDAVNEISYMLLEIAGELHILQPGNSVHISRRTPERFLKEACKVIAKGYGYPSVFNVDAYIKELVLQGKSLEDAREGGCSGCIEVGAFGKEAYLLTGYLNVPKILEVTLNNGVDPMSGVRVGPATGDAHTFNSFEQLYRAFVEQLNYVVDLKIGVSNYIDRVFATRMPATFLSVVIDDCIERGRDYYNAGPRYNTSYIQCTGLGTVADSLSAIKMHVFEKSTFTMERLLTALSNNFEGDEVLRQTIINHTPFFGNDNDYADSIAKRVYEELYRAIDGKRNIKGEFYHLNMLSTTCHVYFGKVTGATPNGRHKGRAISDGTSPSQGADTNGPTAVIHSLGKLDQTKSGGTLLNLRFLPSVISGDSNSAKLASLIRSYFALDGHHIQFNIVDTQTLRDAQKRPHEYRDLLVRMAGYSDYFVHMNRDLQEEIISRTENGGV